jgi:hypothetical protein
MPTNCDPARKWFEGSVVMDVRVTGVDDLFHLESRVQYLASLGIRTLHLRDLTRKPNVTSGDVSEMYLPTEMMISVAQQTVGNRDRFYKAPFWPKTFSDKFSALNFGQLSIKTIYINLCDNFEHKSRILSFLNPYKVEIANLKFSKLSFVRKLRLIRFHKSAPARNTTQAWKRL